MSEDSVSPATFRSLLVLGGARSGKSRYAQDLAESSGKAPVLIATATAGDDEMAARIETHKNQRGESWRAVEEPLALAAALTRESGAEKIIVVDCLTLWLANLMLEGRDVAAESAALADGIAALQGPAIFISNEVGSGIVPDNRLAREFRDAQGRLNQLVAEACDGVVLITAGLALLLKPNKVTLRL